MCSARPRTSGYMSGALKHFFDQIYYPCLDATVGRPYGVVLHGNNDTDGARLAIDKITTGLQWRRAQAPVTVIGEPDEQRPRCLPRARRRARRRSRARRLSAPAVRSNASVAPR